ncbi:MAG: heme o synthase [Bacteroidota bacterium]
MNSSRTAVIKKKDGRGAFARKLHDYQLLTKFRLSSLVVFSSLMAYMMAAGGSVSWLPLVLLGLGGWLVTGAANALNQVLERDYDKLMKRTEDRPLATGRMSVSEAVMSAGFMSMIGITLLALFNPWTSLLGMISLICYSFVYTPMKRVTPFAVFVGAIPGALPTMIGVVAFEGEITAMALVLFAIQFLWQFPHFWAIAWLAHEDYTNAGFYLLPSRAGREDRNTGLQSFIYALFLVPVVVIPYMMGQVGLLSTALLVLLSMAYSFYGWRFFSDLNRQSARKLMFSSFFYLPLVLIVLVLDKL